MDETDLLRGDNSREDNRGNSVEGESIVRD